jgi:hypothetical protein
MIPIADLIKEHRGLVNELARYDYASVAPLIGGFLTLPEYHANTLRLDALAHLACCACNGKRVADREMLINCAGRHFADSQLVMMEDPVEDAFIGNIATGFGNFRVFRGIEESGDFWTERLLRPLEEPEIPEPLQPAISHVSALLRLSEAVAERRGLKRYTFGSGQLRRRLQIPQWRDLQAAACAVYFSPCDLQNLGISSEALAPFILSTESRSQLPSQTTGHSDFERFPLLQLGNDWVMAAPHVITTSVRRFIIEQLNATGFLGFFEMLLHQRQVENWFDALRHDFHFSPIQVELPKPPQDFPPIYQTVMTFDEGKYAHLVMLDGNIKGQLTNAHDVDRVSESQQDAFEKHLVACSETLKQQPGYNAGMAVITRGGVGRGLLMGFKNVPQDWEFIFASLPDWHTLAGCEDMSALRMWRMCRQKEWAEKHGLTIHNINGPLNLYACWRANGWRFLLREIPLEQPHKMLGMEIDFLTGVRRDVDQNRDEHSCPVHNGTGWIRVRRRYPKAYRSKDKSSPMYVALEGIAAGQLLASVETPNRIWWIATEARSADRDERAVVFEMWDCLLNWIGRGVAAIEKAFPGLPRASVWIELEFTELEKWADHAAENLSRPAAAQPYAIANVADRKVILTIPADFKNEFHVPDNRAERAMMGCLIKCIADFTGDQPSEAKLNDLVTAIFPNNEARFFHVLRTESLVQMIGGSDRPSPDFIADEDVSQSLIGLSQAIGGVPQGGKVQGQSECLAYLERAANTLWERIERELKCFSRRAVVTGCLTALAELERDAEHWSMTSRAVLALEEDEAEVIKEADDRRAKRDAASLTARLLAGTAMYACPEIGANPLANAERLGLMADMENLIAVANHRDAISGGFMVPLIHVFPNGELDVDERFYTSVMLPYTHALTKRGFRSAARSYEKWFANYERPDSPEMEKTLSRLEQPFLAEYGITLDQFALILVHLGRLALKEQKLLLEFDESGFLSFLKSECGIEEKIAFLYLERFSLPPRRAWNKNLPVGCTDTDVWPWRFRRQLSLLMRPLILLTNKPERRWLVYPPLIKRSNAYILNGTSEAEFPTEHFRSVQMRRFCGDQANRQGNQFTQAVADRLEQLGYLARREVSMSSLGVPASLGDFGDVDVLAWKLGQSEVFVIECKYLRTAATVRDVVDRLDEFRGERDDYLAKHLRRVNWLKSNPSAVVALTGIPATAIQLKGLLVTDDLVPMQFFSGSAISRQDVVPFNQLPKMVK